MLDFLADLSPWQIALASSWLLLQGCLVPSVPEEILVVTLGALVAQGRIPAPLAVAAVLAGLLPANAVAVLIGSFGHGRRDRRGRLGRLLRSPSVARAAGAVERHGSLAVVATRFVPLVRGPVYLAIGLSGLGVRRFMALDALAACVQVPLLLWVGTRLGAGATPAEAWVRIGWLTAGLLGLAAVALLVRRALAGAGPRDVAAAAPTLPSC